MNISDGTVNAILKQAVQTNNLLTLQHEIAVELQRTGFPMTQFASNLRYKNVITKMGLTGKKLDLILNALDSKFTEDDSIAPDQFAELLLQCCFFILKNQVPLKNLLQEIESKYKVSDNLKAQSNHYNVLRTESEANLKSQLAAADVIESPLEFFTDVRAQLEGYGFELGDLTDIVIFMEDVKDFNGDPELLINVCMDIDSLKKKKINLESQRDTIEKNLELYKLRESEASKQRDYFYQGKLEFDRLVRMGIAPLAIIQITNILAKHPKISLTQLLQEIEIYGSMGSVNFKRKRHSERLDNTIHHSNPVEDSGYC